MEDCYNNIEKRRRSSNFSRIELMLLLKLVKKFTPILNNRKTDAISNTAKAQCWLKIEQIFNSHSFETYRSWSHLKKKYENHKKVKKQQFIDNGKEQDPNQWIDTEISNIFQEIKDESCSSPPFDVPEVKMENTSSVEGDVVDMESRDDDEFALNKETQKNPGQKDDDEVASFNDPTIQLNLGTDYDTYEDCRLQFLKEEFQVKLRQMQKKHELELKLMKEAHLQKMDLQRAEHELELDIKKKTIEQKLSIERSEHEIKLKLLEVELRNKKRDIYVFKRTC
ncbi:unnamed protein product [Brassicogethes aeneus]|uniref:Regulatory protein zeste n=1 Tax=Brassicogethes aeneus TaxID=1431903 RepID=A0A9P0B7E3_BRAAE|nr:unnamed protein product [Brassicogethes aeneus]